MGSCTIWSFYKFYCGTTGQGSLLKAISNRNLTFDGVSENLRTVFYRKNRRNTCKFYVTIDGVNYGICEYNGTIILKENNATTFKIKQIPLMAYCCIYIKCRPHDLYLISDANGKTKLCPSNINDRRGWFLMKVVNAEFDSTDGVEEMDLINNNNNNNNTITQFVTVL